ncbi:MAG: hypothetical protein IPN17_32430 [Deltaproteobacteria bacterium]|nr:hypothetical protein [Deltaproteobacteria bacterium]
MPISGATSVAFGRIKIPRSICSSIGRAKAPVLMLSVSSFAVTRTRCGSGARAASRVTDSSDSREKPHGGARVSTVGERNDLRRAEVEERLRRGDVLDERRVQRQGVVVLARGVEHGLAEEIERRR